MTSPYANVSVDLDNQWAYLKTQGVAGWEDFPSYLNVVVPRILDVLRRQNLRITFFIVGKDAALPANAAVLRSIVEEGHEIANHSFLHEPWLHAYSQAELDADFDQAEAAIEAATGQRPRGFRGPGFSTSPAVRATLRQRGYVYDSSSFPTVIGPLARAYFFCSARLSAEERARRSGLYGGLRQAFGRLGPHEVEPGLMELPVTTLPLLRTPMHLTYLLFLARFSMPLARAYWHGALALCRLTGVAPNLLLHPTDFLDLDDVPALHFFPAMNLPAKQKVNFVQDILRSLHGRWPVAPLIENCRSALQGAVLPITQTQLT